MTKPIYRSERGRREIEDRYRGLLGSSPVPLRTRMVGGGDQRIHVAEAGDPAADPLVLLHGSASNSATWLGDVPQWSRSFRVVAIDIPGHPGLSEGPVVPFEAGAGAAWLEGMLDAIGLPEVRLVGISLGGWIALEFASAYAERVQAMSLLSPGGVTKPRMSFVFKVIPLALLGDRGSDRVQRMVFAPQPVPEGVYEFGRLVARHYRPITKPVPVLSDEQLRALTMPVQVFLGKHDALMRSEESAERMGRMVPSVEVRLLEDEGHAIVGRAAEIGAFQSAVVTR